jgi:hypothetical protein
MGRDDIDMEVLKSVNRMSTECNIMYHGTYSNLIITISNRANHPYLDARPDFSVQSSDYRMEVVTSAAFNHINTFIHPQATIIDHSGDEEPFMFKGLKARALALGRALIELPKDSEQKLMWITRLDSMSLSGKLLVLIYDNSAHKVASLEQSHHGYCDSRPASSFWITDKAAGVAHQGRLLWLYSSSIDNRATP